MTFSSKNTSKRNKVESEEMMTHLTHRDKDNDKQNLNVHRLFK